MYLCMTLIYKAMSSELSNRVKYICSKQGKQLKDLAEAMGIKPESLSRALNGNPQMSTVQSIAKALNVNVADLFPVQDAPPTVNSDFMAMVIDKGKVQIINSRHEMIMWALNMRERLHEQRRKDSKLKSTEE